jgi:hypothetical protein
MPGEQAYIPRNDKLPLLTQAFIKAVRVEFFLNDLFLIYLSEA